jgi:hypothetical protein
MPAKQPPNPGLKIHQRLEDDYTAILVIDVPKLSQWFEQAEPIFIDQIQTELNSTRGNNLNAKDSWIHTAIMEIYQIAEVFMERELSGESVEFDEVVGEYTRFYRSPYMQHPALKRWLMDAGYQLYLLYPTGTMHTQIVIYRHGLLYVYVDTQDPYKPL